MSGGNSSNNNDDDDRDVCGVCHDPIQYKEDCNKSGTPSYHLCDHCFNLFCHACVEKGCKTGKPVINRYAYANDDKGWVFCCKCKSPEEKDAGEVIKCFDCWTSTCHNIKTNTYQVREASKRTFYKWCMPVGQCCGCAQDANPEHEEMCDICMEERRSQVSLNNKKKKKQKVRA